MNLRILKKRCKRAVEVLVTEYRYPADCFEPSDGEESIDAPHGMEKRFVERGWLRPGLLPGTPLYSYRSSCEYDEWDYKLPTELLNDIIFDRFLYAWALRQQDA